MTSYKVNHAAVNVWDASYDLKEARQGKIIHRLRKGDVVSEEDLKYADLKRLTEGANPALSAVEEDAEGESEAEEAYDPKSHSVDEVNDYLVTADEAEVQRVLAEERAGRNRAGVVSGPHAS